MQSKVEILKALTDNYGIINISESKKLISRQMVEFRIGRKRFSDLKLSDTYIFDSNSGTLAPFIEDNFDSKRIHDMYRYAKFGSKSTAAKIEEVSRKLKDKTYLLELSKIVKKDLALTNDYL